MPFFDAMTIISHARIEDLPDALQEEVTRLGYIFWDFLRYRRSRGLQSVEPWRRAVGEEKKTNNDSAVADVAMGHAVMPRLVSLILT